MVTRCEHMCGAGRQRGGRGIPGHMWSGCQAQQTCVQPGWTSAPRSLRLCAVCFCLLIYSGLMGLGLPASTLHVCQELDTRGDTERTKARSLPLSTKRAVSPHQGPVGVVCWFSAWPWSLSAGRGPIPAPLFSRRVPWPRQSSADPSVKWVQQSYLPHQASVTNKWEPGCAPPGEGLNRR